MNTSAGWVARCAMIGLVLGVGLPLSSRLGMARAQVAAPPLAVALISVCRAALCVVTLPLTAPQAPRSKPRKLETRRST